MREQAILNAMSAEQRRRQRHEWSSKVFRGPHALSDIEQDALEEWASMTVRDRLALTWELSLHQIGGVDARMERRLPRSAYRVERG
jgi:hypothetical protein